MQEVWKNVVGYEGRYQVSNLGRVKSVGRYVQNHSRLQYHPEKIKVPSDRGLDGEKGYLTVQLYKENEARNYYVHRLVSEAFIPNPENKATVNHKNGDKHNNNVSNLEWNTYQENNMHAYETGLNDETHRRNNKASIPVEQCSLNGKIVAVYPSLREAERQAGIDCASISLGIRKGWKFGGYMWRRATSDR